MTQLDIKEFLKSGAFVRLNSGKLRVWSGPSRSQIFDDNKVFSVAYRSFFESDLNAVEFTQTVLETETSEFRAQLQSYLEQNPITQNYSSDDFVSPELSDFQQSFQIIQGKIQRGEIEKAVPITFAKSKQIPSIEKRAQMIFHALEAHSELYVYGFWNEKIGIIGASPEILFQLDDQNLKTVALAGTLPDSEKAHRKPLLQDQKELKEHQFVIQDIKNIFEKKGFLKILDTKVLQLPGLAHLKTEINIEGSQFQISELVKSLHPTAALGVFPRNYGVQWLKDLPSQAGRELFGAPLVFSISHQQVLALVAIRCLQWNENGSQVGAGCGIVKSSQLDQEWNEVNVKRQSVMKVLGLVS